MYTRATARTAERLEKYACELASLVEIDEWEYGGLDAITRTRVEMKRVRDLKRVRKRLRSAAIAYAKACAR